MREYECLYILHPKLVEEEINNAATQFGQVVTDNQGELLLTNLWGKRRLAYEINHVREGSYVLMRFNAETEAVEELDRLMKYSENVLRHIIVRAEDLDPAVTNSVPEQLPEPGTEDQEGPRRRYSEGGGRYGSRGDYGARQQSAEASASDEALEEVPVDAETGDQPTTETVGEVAVDAPTEEVAAPAEAEPASDTPAESAAPAESAEDSSENKEGQD